MALSKIRNDSLADTAVHGRRNLIINGAMQVAQRSTSGTLSSAHNYFADRFRLSRMGSAGDVFDISVASDAPEGFKKSTKWTQDGTSVTLSGTNAYGAFQIIEGYNIQGLDLGSGTAKQLTVSFWVKCSLAIDLTVTLADDGNTTNVGKLYTINSADTWEYKTITFPAPTTGSFPIDNGIGLQLGFGIAGNGDSRKANKDSWGAANSAGSSVVYVDGADHTLATTSGATWQLTGVQLEVGDTATPFEHRSYGEELALCQRYYFKEPGTVYGGRYGSGESFAGVSFPTTMRTSPTLSYSAVRTTTGLTAYRTKSTAQYLMSHTSGYVTGLEADAEL